MNVWLWTLVIVVLVPPAGPQSAQSSDTGVLTGSAVDSYRLPIPAVKVYLERVGKKELLSAQTDSLGVYRFTALSGTYTVRAESDTEGEASAGPFAIAHNKVTTIDLVLQPSAAAKPQFFDEPHFTVVGVTDNTYRGGHGADTVLRSEEELTKATASLGNASQNTDAADAHHVLGEIQERSGHPLEAVQEFQRAAELNPGEANLFDWGTELLAHRAPQPAAEVFAKGVRLFPESVRMLLGLAAAWYAAGSYEQAAQCFFRAADLNPRDPSPYLFLSKVRSREITQAAGYEERLARFARLQPGNALANYYYAVSLWNRRDRTGDAEASRKALVLLKRAVTLDPHLGPAYLQLGIVYVAERNYPNAIRAYGKAIEANPESEEPHYRLSEAFRLTGEQVRAKQELGLYTQLSKQSSERVERERLEIQQFVVALRSQNSVSETKKTQ